MIAISPPADLWNHSIANGLLANIYFGVLTVGGLIALLSLRRWRIRRKLTHFLGAGRTQEIIPIRPSHLWLQELLRREGGPGRTTPVSGYRGPLILMTESSAFFDLRELIDGPRIEGSAPLSLVLWKRLFDSSLKAHIEINVEPTIVHDGTIVVLGTGKYNALSQAILESDHSFVRFAKDTRAGRKGQRTFEVRSDRREQNWEPKNGRHADARQSCELAVVQRIHEPDSRSTIVTCFGLSAPATHAAVHYLVNHWPDLESEFGPASQTDFAVILRLPDQDRERPFWVDTRIVRESSFRAPCDEFSIDLLLTRAKSLYYSRQEPLDLRPGAGVVVIDEPEHDER